jgi:integrase
LRIGEVLGLTTDRVAFLRHEIHVEQQLQGGQLAPLKTRSSRRIVPADDLILLKISQHLERFPSDGLLITSKVHKPVQHSVFAACFRKAAAKAKLPPGVVFHDLRHTHGSMLVASGEDITEVSARLGHKHPSLTWDIYMHSLPHRRGRRGAIEAAFAEPARESAREV